LKHATHAHPLHIHRRTASPSPRPRLPPCETIPSAFLRTRQDAPPTRLDKHNILTPSRRQTHSIGPSLAFEATAANDRHHPFSAATDLCTRAVTRTDTLDVLINTAKKGNLRCEGADRWMVFWGLDRSLVRRGEACATSWYRLSEPGCFIVDPALLDTQR